MIAGPGAVRDRRVRVSAPGLVAQAMTAWHLRRGTVPRDGRQMRFTSRPGACSLGTSSGVLRRAAGGLVGRKSPTGTLGSQAEHQAQVLDSRATSRPAQVVQCDGHPDGRGFPSIDTDLHPVRAVQGERIEPAVGRATTLTHC